MKTNEVSITKMMLNKRRSSTNQKRGQTLEAATPAEELKNRNTFGKIKIS